MTRTLNGWWVAMGPAEAPSVVVAQHAQGWRYFREIGSRAEGVALIASLPDDFRPDGSWSETDPVYGSPAYQADYHSNEALLMDDEERWRRGL